MTDKYHIDINKINQTLNLFSDTKNSEAAALIQLLNYSQSTIKTDDELLDKLQLIESLTELETNQNAFLVIILDYLIANIETYQASEQSTPNQVLAKLMKQANVKQKELSHIVPQSIISELVNGKRQLTLRHIQCFADFFNVPISYFLKNE